MLRLVLAAVLSLSVVGCRSKDETVNAEPGVAAGKVLEISGEVKVRRGDVPRPLATGEAVEGDDTITTGADGHAVILLIHNAATWELGPNQQQKVRESTAWKLAKSAGPAKNVEQDTASGGRPAERNAADTTVSAEADVTTKGGGASPSGAGSAVAGGERAGADPRTVAAEILRKNTASIASCLEQEGASVTVVLHVAADRSIKVDVIGPGTVASDVKSCVVDIVTKLARDHNDFPHTELDVSIDVSR